jgi:segregation and condensation protein B
LSAVKLAALAQGLTAAEIRAAVGELNKLYSDGNHSFEIDEIAGGFRMLTHAGLGEALSEFFARRSKDRLSRAALETLAIIAYKQPATRAVLETIRGVASDSVVANLIDLGLVRISGQAESPGRPTLYSTTKKFLDHFGLKSLRELPREKDFDAMEKA